MSTGQGLIGYNMYAYCGNNPVLFADYNGRSSSSALAKVIAVTLRLAAPYLKALQNKIREKVMENRKTSKACEDFIKEYDPSNPDADADGYVSYPNVNTVTEMTNLIDASRAYEANTTAFEASKQIAQSGMSIGK